MLVFLIFTFSVNAEKSKWGKISTETWQELQDENCRFEDPKIFLEEVDYYVEKISNYLNAPEWYKDDNGLGSKPKINFTATERASRVVSRGLFPEVKLNKVLFKKGYTPLTHEITHIITGGNLISLKEGLANYMQEKYGRNITLMNFGAPIHPLAKEFIKMSNQDLIDKLSQNVSYSYFDNWFERRNFYILSHSFVKYLINEYGIKKFMRVYNSNYPNEMSEKVYNKDLDDLENEWLKYLEEIETFDYSYKEWLNKKLDKDFAKGFYK